MKNIVSPHHKFYLGRLVEGSNIFLELSESTDNFGGQQGVNLSALHVISASYKTSLSLTSAVAIAGVGIVRLSHYKALFGFPTQCFVYHNSPETNNLDFFNSDTIQTSCTSNLETTHGAQIHVSGHFQERAGGKL